jgi:hypothetical protein
LGCDQKIRSVRLAFPKSGVGNGATGHWFGWIAGFLASYPAEPVPKFLVIEIQKAAHKNFDVATSEFLPDQVR